MKSGRPFCLAPYDCAAPGPRHCQRCAQLARYADPAARARHLAGVRRREADPEYRARRDQAAAANGRKAVQHADRAKGGRTRSRTALGWLPVARREEYARLRRELGAQEARRIIEADIAARDLVAAREAIAAIERQQIERRRRERAEAY